MSMSGKSVSGFFKRALSFPEQLKKADKVFDEKQSKKQCESADECTRSSEMDLESLQSLEIPIVKV